MSAPDPGARRRSNEGYRKLDLEERVLIFLTRIRRKRSFKELGYLYGCGKASAQRYYEELRALFCTEMVPRLVFPRPPEELLQMADEATLQQFPDLLAVLDATNWQQQTGKTRKFFTQPSLVLCLQAFRRVSDASR